MIDYQCELTCFESRADVDINYGMAVPCSFDCVHVVITIVMKI